MALERKKKAKQVKKKKPSMSEKSELGVKYNIRISTPNGYYPEDVDKLILEFEDQLAQQDREIESMAKERDNAITQRDQAIRDREKLQAEYTRLQISISSMDFPDQSFESDIQNIGKINEISGNEDQPTVEVNRPISSNGGGVDVLGLVDINTPNQNNKQPQSSPKKKNYGDIEILGLK